MGKQDISYLASPAAIGMVISPENTCRPDGILMLDANHAMTVGVAVYSNEVTSNKVTSQFDSTDMSRAYLSWDGYIYNSVKQKREEWCAKHLHETKTVRVHFAFPKASNPPPSAVTLFRELEVKGGSRIPVEKGSTMTRLGMIKAAEWDERHQLSVQSKDEHDVIVNIDQTNLSQWFGPRTRDVVALLKIATGVDDGWVVQCVDLVTSRLFCFYFLNSLRESPYRSGGMVPDANIMYPFSFSNLCIYATRQALGPTFEYFINF